MEDFFLKIYVVIFSCLLSMCICCLHEGQQVETSLNNAIFVSSARSTVECTLQCQRLKKTPFYTNDERCYCVEDVQIQNSSVDLHPGTLFNEVLFGTESSETIMTNEKLPLIVSEMVNYTISGVLRISCTSDHGRQCELHGNLILNIGTLPENQNIAVWFRPKTSLISKSIGDVYEVLINYQFKESKTFSTIEDEFVMLEGKVQEYDGETSKQTSNVLADFFGEIFTVKEIFETDKIKRINGDTGYAEVKLKVFKV